MNKKLILAVLTLCLIVAGAVYLSSTPQIVKAAQGTGTLLKGWAWSSNIGWVSMNCENTEDVGCTSYGVAVDSSNNLNGYAWSSNIGWIKFDPVGPYPSGSGTTDSAAKLNITGDKLVGWARALTPVSNPAAAGGWDGWISLAGTDYGINRTSDGTNYKYEGFAWGSDVIGWLKFDHSGSCTTDVCDDGDGGGLSAICSVTTNGPNLDWSVATINGSASFVASDYTYAWFGYASPGTTRTVTTGVPDTSQSSSATVTRISDSKTGTCPAVTYNPTCSQSWSCTWSVCDPVTLTEIPTCNDPNVPICLNPASKPGPRSCSINPAKLEVAPDRGTISVNSSNQSNPAVSSVGVLRNIGGVAGDFKVFSFMSRMGIESVYDIITNSSEYPSCIYQPFADISAIPNFRLADFTSPPPGAITGICNSIGQINVAPNQYLAFAIKLPVPLESYRSDSRLPYRIRINPVAGNIADGATILWTSFTGPTTPR